MIGEGWEDISSSLDFIQAGRNGRGMYHSAFPECQKRNLGRDCLETHMVFVAVTSFAVMVLSAKVSVFVVLTSTLLTTALIEVWRY